MAVSRPKNVTVAPSFTLANPHSTTTYTFRPDGDTVEVSRDEGKVVHIYTVSLTEARATWSMLRKRGFERA